MRITCPAKLNLALAVGPPLGAEAGAKRGFHSIASWFVPVGLADELVIEPLSAGAGGAGGAAGAGGAGGAGRASSLSIEWAADAPRPSPIDWPIEKDLAYRAHRLLERHAGRALPAALRLIKRVPVGGGLGGGSADAAGAIRGLNRAFALGLSAAQERALGAELGSDVAFFLDDEDAASPAGGEHAGPRPALVTGLGEELRRLTRVPGWAVLIVPGFGCPTGAVYKAFDAALPERFRQDEVYALIESAIGAQRIEPAALFNDLTPPAERVAPDLAPLRRACAKAIGEPVHVTGSGSTMFAWFAGQSEAERAAAALRGLPVATVVTSAG
jgi:4-diphosphocytidyl-2-C-methyl-D-erythritol kinase